jgi:hypothetical protein
LRGDSFTGTTRNFRLLRDYFNAEGNMDDPLAGSGAEFVFVAIDSGILPRGEEIGFRGDLEDAIADRLGSHHSGEAMGGACGTELSYIDLIIYDGARSLQHIRDVLIERGLPEGTGIHFFAKGNEGRRIFL